MQQTKNHTDRRARGRTLVAEADKDHRDEAHEELRVALALARRRHRRLGRCRLLLLGSSSRSFFNCGFLSVWVIKSLLFWNFSIYLPFLVGNFAKVRKGGRVTTHIQLSSQTGIFYRSTNWFTKTKSFRLDLYREFKQAAHEFSQSKCKAAAADFWHYKDRQRLNRIQTSSEKRQLVLKQAISCSSFFVLVFAHSTIFTTTSTSTTRTT